MGNDLTELLEELREYMESRADADQPSGERPSANAEMRFMMRLDEARQEVKRLHGLLRDAGMEEYIL